MHAAHSDDEACALELLQAATCDLRERLHRGGSGHKFISPERKHRGLLMQTCDVAVVGLGLMGSAALDALLVAGIDALGFDPLGPGAVQGSSHGSCRVFRRFNFENDNYTNLSDEALQGWMRLRD